MPRHVVAACALILLAGCSGSAPPTAAPTTNPVVASTPAQTTAPLTAAPAATPCNLMTAAGFPHQAPEIEAVLPATVAGRALTRWSVRGRCWPELLFNTPAAIDAFVAEYTTPGNPNPIDGTNLVYGVAGRLDTKSDPPFFVYAAVLPANDDEVALALTLLRGGAGFHDVSGASDQTRYQQKTIAGKDVYVGSLDMLDQDTHQRGRPFLYANNEYMFLVITDDDTWAADAIEQLP